MVGCGSKNGHQNAFKGETLWDMSGKRDWTICSKSIFFILDTNSQHNWGRGVDKYDRLITQRIFTLIVNRIFIRTHKIMRKVTMC